MSKRELNISNKPLFENTKEDIILKSPLRIPPKGLQNLKILKGINNNDYAYYDLAGTENQVIKSTDTDLGSTSRNYKPYFKSPKRKLKYSNNKELKMVMGSKNNSK